MKTFYVTFGIAHPLSKYYIIIHCKDFDEAHRIVNIQFARYAEIYTQEQWNEFAYKKGTPFDAYYGLKMAAIISNYKYSDNYKD